MNGAIEITCDDPRYPLRLNRLESPPPCIYARGDLTLLERRACAIIGSRRPSNYGLRVAYDAARAAASAGVAVVSGLARGLDSRAHRAALDVGGPTVAVLGYGMGHCYPPGHEALQEEIASRGLLLSEYSPDTEPRKWQFPARNRLIAALADVVLVVQGRADGGTSNTAEWAMRLPVTLMAVPGRIDDPLSGSPNSLLRDGARPYTEPDDLLRALGLATGRRPAALPVSEELERQGVLSHRLQGAEATLFDLINAEPQDVDTLLERSHLPPPLALAALSALELQGLVEQLPGKRFALAT